MFMEIQTVALALRRDAQNADPIHDVHDNKADRQSRDGDYSATHELSSQDLRPTAIEKTFQRRGIVGSEYSRHAILTGRKQPQRKRSPDSAHSMDWNGANRVVNTQILEHLHTSNDDKSCDSAKSDRSRRAYPVA